MRSIHFDGQGFKRTYGDLLVAAGFSVGVFFSILGDIGRAARWPSSSDFGAPARRWVGVRPLLCRHHGCELEIPVYLTHRFLSRCYIMFDRGGMAFSEASFHAYTAIARYVQFRRARTRSTLR